MEGIAFTEQTGSSFQVGLNNGRLVTIIPQPLQKPFRRFEIVAGLACVATGVWMLAQFGFWLAGAVPHLEIRSMGDATLLLVQSLYLLGFGGNLLRSGYIALVFWIIAVAILVALPVTADFSTAIARDAATSLGARPSLWPAKFPVYA